MPSLDGKELISEITEKVGRRTVVVALVAILIKVYDVPLNDLIVLGMNLPAPLFDTVLLIVIVFLVYSLTVNWLGDLAAFRLWNTENATGSQSKVQGAVPLMMRLYQLERKQSWPPDFAAMDEETRRQYDEFKTKVERYTDRLEHTGTKFTAISWYGRYYVWVQCFGLPIVLSVVAFWLLLTRGDFVPPM